MKFRKFQTKDFPIYQSWFIDELLNEHLGPAPDEEWLDYILKEENNGRQYSIFEEEKLVAVLGIIFPDSAHPHLYITDIAVNPAYRNQKIGIKVLTKLLILHPLPTNHSYKAFVDLKNINAKFFFKKLGWHLESDFPDKDNMLTFTFSF